MTFVAEHEGWMLVEATETDWDQLMTWFDNAPMAGACNYLTRPVDNNKQQEGEDHDT